MNATVYHDTVKTGDHTVEVDTLLPASQASAVLICAADIQPEPVDWLWDDWLAGGKLHIVAGAPGTGKTTIALQFAAVVSIGGIWPDGSRSPIGNVLIWSGEDGAADTIIPG